MRRLRMTCMALLFAAFSAALLAAQSRETLWFGMNAGADFPLFEADRYLGIGPITGFHVGVRLPFFAFVTSEVEIGGALLPVAGGSSLTGIDAILRVGAEFPPGGPLSASLYGLGGYLQGILLGAAPFSRVSDGSIIGGGGLAARLRITDSWSISAGAEAWTAVGLGPFVRGFLGGRFHPVLRSLKPLPYELKALSVLEFSELSVADLFPVLYEYYESRPVGRVRIENTSDKPVTDLKVSFLVEDHMDRAMPCPAVSRLGPGESASIDLFALFSEEVLEVTELKRVTAKVLFDYTVEVWSMHQEASTTMSLYARNEITWDDDRRAAAFVTTRDPAVLQFGRNTAAWVDAEGAEAVNANLRVAMGLFEALRLYGMTYVVDPSLPYDVVSTREGAVDFLQFPRETLLYSTGDCDDLSILFCSLLQSLDIDTAFVTVPGHIFVAVSLGMSADDARRLFSRPDDLIYRDGAAWLPVEITALDASFLEAWALGAGEWREAVAKESAGFFPVSAAWKEFKPVGVPMADAVFDMPSSGSFRSVYGPELAGYVAREIGPQVQALKAAINLARDKPPAYNRLGVLYARYGMSADALDQFDLALKVRDYLPALVNKGNVLFLEGSYREALSLYQRAIGIQPDTAAALLGLARTHHALRNYARVTEPYEKLKKVNPALAAKYPYLDAAAASKTRAAEAAGETRNVPWDYGE